MEKIVFLDIDGVLNSGFWNESHQREISDGTLIDEEKVALLGKLVKRTGAKLVLHSGWRFWFGEGLQPLRKEAERFVEVLKLYDMVITDVTPDLTTEEICRTKKFSLVKAQEILAWLEKHPRISRWIVLDDLELHDASVKRQQVQTDANVGLTEGDVEKAALKLEHDCDIEQAKLINRVGMCETYECPVCGCEFSVFFNMPLPFFEPQPQCRVYV